MKILDLYCGMGGWARGLIDSGHEVIGYDIEDFSSIYPGRFIRADLLSFSDFPHADVIVASPPCTEFSKSSFPKTWQSVRKNPLNIELALKLFNRVYEIVDLVKPKFYIIENVRGAQKYVGKAREHKGSRYLWGNYPEFSVEDSPELYGKYRMSPSSDRPIIRSLIPYSIARGLGEVLE